MGDMGRLRSLDLFAGGFSECAVGGTSTTTLSSRLIVSESNDRLEVAPKDSVRLSELEVVETTKDLARFIL